LPEPLSVEDFPLWEEKQELRFDFAAAGGVLRMPEIAVEIPLALCYECVLT